MARASTPRGCSRRAASVLAGSLPLLAVGGTTTRAAEARRFAAPAPPAGFDLPTRHTTAHGARMAWYAMGEGPPVLFLHGLPTWSYLWRNVMPRVAAAGHRAVALDLLGFGRSDRPEALDLGYAEQARHLDGFVAALGLRDVVLVGHDWGAALAVDHASRNAGVRAVAYLEAALAPVWPRPSYATFGPQLEPLFRRFRDPVAGRQVLMAENAWVERLLPASVLRPLGAEEMAAYREPFRDAASRRAIFELTASLPIAGEPAATAAAMQRADGWWRRTALPKLVLYAEPSRLTPEPLARWAVANLKNVETAYVGRGLHYLQEDEPEAIGRALAEWLRRLPA